MHISIPVPNICRHNRCTVPYSSENLQLPRRVCLPRTPVLRSIHHIPTTAIAKVGILRILQKRRRSDSPGRCQVRSRKRAIHDVVRQHRLHLRLRGGAPTVGGVRSELGESCVGGGKEGALTVRLVIEELGERRIVGQY